MQQPRIEIAVEPQLHEIEFVTQQILNFNSNRAGEGNYKPLVIFLRDSDNCIVGGLTGETYWQWLHVDVLWVDESWRGQGYGEGLLNVAEQEAMKRGCQYAYLDTLVSKLQSFTKRMDTLFSVSCQTFPRIVVAIF